MNLTFLKGKKILIAGGAGLLGTNLTKFLISHGISVQSTYFSRLPPKPVKESYQQYDFTKYEDCLAATQGKDIAILCGIQAYGVKGLRQSQTSSVLSNLKMQAGLFEACHYNKVEKVVWISSSTVYQEAFYPIHENQLDLNLPPYDLYQGVAWVYRYIEELAKCYNQQEGLPIGIIRTSSIYGPYDRFDDERSHVVPALIKRTLKRENPFRVWGSELTIRDFVYVDDLVQAVLRVLKNYCVADPINFSNGAAVSVRKLVEVVLDVCDHPIIPQYDETKPTAAPYRVLDNTKFDTLLGGVERTPLKEGIRKTVEWYTSTMSRD